MNQQFFSLGIALALGMLVGLQRERVDSEIAGLRTFGLVALLGAVCAQLGPWPLAVGFLAVTSLTVVGNLAKIRGGQVEPGMTTEVALILLYGVGALVVVASPEIGLVVAGATAVLLHFKEELHRWARRMGERDFDSVIQFILLTLVILPVLPDEGYGPYGVLNPREIWLMVVLIVGIGLAGYLGYRLLGRRGGSLVGGLVGGLISSTATTVNYSRRSHQGTVSSSSAAVALLLASAVVFVRVLFEVAVVGPSLLMIAGPPLAVLLVAQLLFTAVVWRRTADDGEGADLPSQGNPTELKSALVFGFLYGAVSLAVAWAEDQLGPGGLYTVAVLSGLTDMDAITLSTSRLVESGALAAELGWRVIVLASLANLLFKAGILAFWASRGLRRRMFLWWGVTLVLGGLILWGWPT